MASRSVPNRRPRELIFKVVTLSGCCFLVATAWLFQDALLTVWFPLQIGLAWLVADLFSGLLHCFIERVVSRFASFDWFVTPFLEHHDQCSLEDQTWYATFSYISVLLFAFLSVLYLFALPPVFAGFWIWMVAISYMNPAIHRLSHRPLAERPPWFVGMQRWGLVLGSAHHAVHHAQPDRNYCFVSGHVDLLLNRFTTRK